MSTTMLLAIAAFLAGVTMGSRMRFSLVNSLSLGIASTILFLVIDSIIN